VNARPLLWRRARGAEPRAHALLGHTLPGAVRCRDAAQHGRGKAASGCATLPLRCCALLCTL